MQEIFMSEMAQIRARVPRALKRAMFVKLAHREEKFTRWLRNEMAAYVSSHDDSLYLAVPKEKNPKR